MKNLLCISHSVLTQLFNTYDALRLPQTLNNMTKLIFFSLLIIIAVIHQFHAAKLVHTPEEINEKISFVEVEEDNDETTKLKEKIKMEMEAYKLGKDKKKPTTTTTSTTTTTEAPTSSTLVHVYLVGIDGDEDDEEATESSTVDSSTRIDDRYIINAPVLCRDGEKTVDGRCRKIFSRMGEDDEDLEVTTATLSDVNTIKNNF